MFEENLRQFVADFGVDAIFSRDGSDYATIRVLYEAPPDEMALYDRSFYDEKFYGLKLASNQVAVFGVAEDLAQLAEGDGCQINGEDYIVQIAKTDGTGFALVALSRNNA